MKSELLHLLNKLSTAHADFQNIVIPVTGGPVFITLQHGFRRFESLDELELWTYRKPTECTLLCERDPHGLGKNACDHKGRCIHCAATLPNPQSAIPNPK
jgi:hypothetical protein